MRKRWFKKGVSILLAGSMVFSMAACSNHKEQQNANNEEAKKYVFNYEELDLGLEGYDDYYMNSIQYINDKLYFIVQADKYGENYISKLFLITMNPDGSERTETEIKQPENENAVTGDIGDVDLLRSSMPEVIPEEEVPVDEEEPQEDASAEESEAEESEEIAVEEPIDDIGMNEDWAGQVIVNRRYDWPQVRDAETIICIEDVSTDDYTVPDAPVYKRENNLLCLDNQGNEVWRVALQPYLEEVEYPDVRCFLTDSKDNIYLLFEERCLVFDRDGNNISAAVLEKAGISDAFVDAEDNIKIISWNDDYTERYMATLDTKTGKETGAVELPSMLGNYDIRMGHGYGYEIILTDDLGVYGFNNGDTEPTQIMSFINSDLNATYLEQITFLEEEKFVASYWDQSDNQSHVSMFTAVAPEDIPDKQAVIIGCDYMDYNVRNRVVAFNKESQEYRIVIKEYSKYNSSDDWEAGVTQLNNDILSGNTPDILLVSRNMPMESYISKGLFTDLYKLIEKDEELNSSDYLQNVFEAYSINGKLYQLVPSFSIETFAAKQKWVGDRNTWTIEEMQDILEQMPEGATLLGKYYSRETMLSVAMNYTSEQFMDKESGKCSFDSQEFMDLLTYIATYPSEEDIAYDEEYWNDYEVQWREDRTLLSSWGISNLQDFHRTMQGYMGEPYTLVGFPAGDKNGSVISPNLNFAISEKSACKDGAWEFVRYYLTDEYQENLEWGLPLKEEVLQDLAVKAMQKPYREDENGNREEYDDYFYVGGMEIPIEPMTEEEAQTLIDFIKSVDTPSSYNTDIINIINEEAAGFFAGQKSVEEVTKIIQSRIQIYVSENR